MRNLRRYLGLLQMQLKAALMVSLHYRVDFFVNIFLGLFWSGAALVPILVLFGQRKSFAGWNFAEALVVVACFTFLKGLLNSFIQPPLQRVVEHVRQGTLDFILLKPADAQFLISTTYFEPRELADCFTGFAILAYAMHLQHRHPSLHGSAMAVVLLAGAVAILYSIWIFVISLAFRFVKVDNLSYLFGSLYDMARFPAGIFRGASAFVFTFILPLALMTTYPALALNGKLAGGQVGMALAVAALFMAASRFVWSRSIRHYTSAGG